MSALSADRRLRFETWKRRKFSLPTGYTAYKGGLAAYDQSAGKAIPVETGASQTDLFLLGVFDEKVANSSGSDMDVVVALKDEIQILWLANDTDNPVTANDIGKCVYGVDDQTVSVSSASSTRSPVGTAWAVDSTLGVAVQLSHEAADESRLQALETRTSELADGATLVFAANDAAPTAVVHDSTYSVPSTGAASTITLPAAAADGTRIYVVADGSANAHTVQYRDATGPTNLTTALTASKRHLVVCVKEGSKWYANAYVSP